MSENEGKGSDRQSEKEMTRRTLSAHLESLKEADLDSLRYLVISVMYETFRAEAGWDIARLESEQAHEDKYGLGFYYRPSTLGKRMELKAGEFLEHIQQINKAYEVNIFYEIQQLSLQEIMNGNDILNEFGFPGLSNLSRKVRIRFYLEEWNKFKSGEPFTVFLPNQVSKQVKIANPNNNSWWDGDNKIPL